MTKLLSTVAILVLGLIALGTEETKIAAILHALVPIILVAGITAGVLRAVWWYTR
jgi:hypothetical protein